MNKSLTITMSFVIFILAACQSVGPPPTATPQPTETLPEQPAKSIEQVSGMWAIRLMGGGGGDPAVFTLTPDGTFSMDGISGDHEGMNVGYGTYRFKDDVFLLESDACLGPIGPSDTFVTCTASYNVFVSIVDGKPAQIRFVAIDDPFVDRKKTLDNKTFTPYIGQ